MFDESTQQPLREESVILLDNIVELDRGDKIFSHATCIKEAYNNCYAKKSDAGRNNPKR